MRTTYNTSPPLANVISLNRGGYSIVNQIVVNSQTGTTVRFAPVFLFAPKRE